jgi:hypothetical protein
LEFELEMNVSELERRGYAGGETRTLDTLMHYAA